MGTDASSNRGGQEIAQLRQEVRMLKQILQNELTRHHRDFLTYQKESDMKFAKLYRLFRIEQKKNLQRYRACSSEVELSGEEKYTTAEAWGGREAKSLKAGEDNMRYQQIVPPPSHHRNYCK
ncbi:hypothetical protein [Chitinivibrio alkaliphilus]|uniref:Uncharacterized protein n=1 Tax=Chitinivibrio alkaliphilus ACht1 TaxID=1313304 RepID=U7DAF3_9BACT|nr:hypothetical protein [Chitinivibrio alkaliphilus]ERP32112.1 hypothetical protein CALK_0834 [Chitinivibrio alkaliphilus ACht1]